MQGDLIRAEKFAQKEKSLNPKLEYGYLLLGEIYEKKGKLDDAIRSYKLAQTQNNRSLIALKSLANIYFKKNNMEKALDLYMKGAKVSPSDASIRKKLGDVYKKLGQGVLANESYSLYLELNPDARDRKVIESYIKSSR